MHNAHDTRIKIKTEITAKYSSSTPENTINKVRFPYKQSSSRPNPFPLDCPLVQDKIKPQSLSWHRTDKKSAIIYQFSTGGGARQVQKSALCNEDNFHLELQAILKKV